MLVASRISVIRLSLLLLFKIPGQELCSVLCSPSLDLVCPEVHVRNIGLSPAHGSSTTDVKSGFESSSSTLLNNDYSTPQEQTSNWGPSPSPCCCYSGSYQQQNCQPPKCWSSQCPSCPWPCFYHQPQCCQAPSYCIQSVVVSGAGDVTEKNSNGNGPNGNNSGTPGGSNVAGNITGNGGGVIDPVTGGGGLIDPVSGGGGFIDPFRGGGGVFPGTNFPGWNSSGCGRSGGNNGGENRYEKYLDKLLNILEDTKRSRCCCSRPQLYVIPQTCTSSANARERNPCRKKKRRRCRPPVVIFEDDGWCPCPRPASVGTCLPSRPTYCVRGPQPGCLC